MSRRWSDSRIQSGVRRIGLSLGERGVSLVLRGIAELAQLSNAPVDSRYFSAGPARSITTAAGQGVDRVSAASLWLVRELVLMVVGMAAVLQDKNSP